MWHFFVFMNSPADVICMTNTCLIARMKTSEKIIEHTLMSSSVLLQETVSELKEGELQMKSEIAELKAKMVTTKAEGEKEIPKHLQPRIEGKKANAAM